MKKWIWGVGGALVAFIIGIGAGSAAGGATPAAVTNTETATLVNTRTVDGPTVTVTHTVPAKTVFKVKTRVRTRTVRVGGNTGSSGGSGGIYLRGNGSKDVPINVIHESTLYWTNDGDLFQVWDKDYSFNVNSGGHSGSTYVPAGHYIMTVNAIGNWTIRIK